MRVDSDDTMGKNTGAIGSNQGTMTNNDTPGDVETKTISGKEGKDDDTVERHLPKSRGVDCFGLPGNHPVSDTKT